MHMLTKGGIARILLPLKEPCRYYTRVAFTPQEMSGCRKRVKANDGSEKINQVIWWWPFSLSSAAIGGRLGTVSISLEVGRPLANMHGNSRSRLKCGGLSRMSIYNILHLINL
jgi:hypothetical protein